MENEKSASQLRAQRVKEIKNRARDGSSHRNRQKSSSQNENQQNTNYSNKQSSNSKPVNATQNELRKRGLEKTPELTEEEPKIKKGRPRKTIQSARDAKLTAPKRKKSLQGMIR